MKSKYIYQFLGFITIGLLVIACVEEFDFESITFKSSLVVEATITDEYKKHEVLLSRTFDLKEEGPKPEINSEIKILDDIGNIYNFKEADSGRYVSLNKFSAIPNTSYKLQIKTSNGTLYESNEIQLSSNTQEFNIYASRGINEEGVDGVTIYVNSFDATGSSKYYRYKYEETYKIIAPYWSPLDAFGVSMLPTRDETPLHEVYTLPRTKEEQTCFNTLYSDKILQTETTLLSEDRVSDYPIRFIAKDDFIITHRYTILIDQIIQSYDSYNYYKTLNDISSSKSLFSQLQPGFVYGNLKSITNENEQVIGFFDVASSKSKRLFFNFEDFFPTEAKPPYVVSCNLIAPDLDDRSLFGNPEFSPLIKLLMFDGLKFVDFNDTINNPNNPYWIVKKECGDCTNLGTNIVPDFWAD